MRKNTGGVGALLRTFLTVGMMRFAALPLTLGTSIILARILGTTDFGLFSFAVALAGMLALPVGDGASHLVTREAVRADEAGSPGLLKGLQRRTWQILAAYSLVVLIVVGIAHFGFQTGSIGVLSAALMAPLLARVDIDSAFMRAFRRPALSQLCSMLLRPVAVLLVSLVIWAFGMLSLAGALAAQVLASLMVLVISVIMLKRIMPETPTANPIYADRSWASAYPSFLLISSMSFFSVSIGIIWLGFIGDPEGASGMRVGQSAGQLVQLALIAVNLVVQPQLAQRGSGATDKQDVIAPFIHGARLSLGGSLLVGVPLFFFASPLIDIVYGADFVTLATIPTQLVIIGQIFNAAAGPSGMLLAMSGNEKLAFRGQLAGLIATLIFVALLSLDMGATGAAAGIALGLIVKNGIELIYLRRIYNRWLTPFSRLP